MSKRINPKGDFIYHETISQILKHGEWDKNPRARYSDGEEAYSRFITQKFIKYDILNDQSPMITTRPIAWKSAIAEILWIYQDQSNDLDLLRSKYGISWWDNWDIGDGTIGKRYGDTVKRYDLMNKLLKDLKENPFGRRHILSLWQDEDMNSDGLNPCAFMTIWSVRKLFGNDNKFTLDCTLIQRSSDFLVSGPINEIQYIALMMMVAKSCGYKPGNFAHFIQNVHIYDRHINIAEEILHRKYIDCNPILRLSSDTTDFYDFKVTDFEMIDYPIDKIKQINPQYNKLKTDIAI